MSRVRKTSWAGVLALTIAVATGAATATEPATSIARRVMLVSIDGLRPDVLLRANAPNLRGLMSRGSFSMWAMTTAMSVTLPSHVSMLTGVPPEKHGIVWNSDLPFSRPVYPRQPTLFELAKHAGYTTAMVAGKSKFSALAKPGTLDWSFVPEPSAVSDSTVADTAVRWIRVHRPQVLFVHLAGVDLAGHEHGWGSDEQLIAVATADRSLGRILSALRSRSLLDSTVVLVSADHGGAGLSHGPDDQRSRRIPWIAAGPGIRKNLDLTRIEERDVRTEDTFATLTYVLGIPLPDGIDGRPQIEILDGSAHSTQNLDSRH